MKLRDFLKLFEGMDPELPVCVADWRGPDTSFHWSDPPQEDQAEAVCIVKGREYRPTGSDRLASVRGTFIQIGDEA